MEPSPTSSPFAATDCRSCGAPFTPAVAEQQLCDACEGLVEPEPSSPLREADVAGHRLVHQLGSGRFSTSWIAEPAGGGGGVVLKLLRSYGNDAASVQRFAEETRRLSGPTALDHPGVARLLGGGVQLGGAFFLVYEGGGDTTLADELRARGRMLLSRALELCAQLADALEVVHRAGVVHDDLKPANVGLARDDLGNEHAVLLDAATAHLVAHAGGQDAGVLPLSSAAFTSPEAARGLAPGPRADFYALGILLYQLATGRLPVLGATTQELLLAHREHRPLKLRDAGKRVHPEVEGVLARLLAKDPQDRFENGRDLAAALRALARVADQAPADQPQDEVEDPVPITVAEPPPPLELDAGDALDDGDDAPGEEPGGAAARAALSRAQNGGATAGAGALALLPAWATPLRLSAAALAGLLVLGGGFALRGKGRRAAQSRAASPAAPAEAPARGLDSAGAAPSASAAAPAIATAALGAVPDPAPESARAPESAAAPGAPPARGASRKRVPLDPPPGVTVVAFPPARPRRAAATSAASGASEGGTPAGAAIARNAMGKAQQRLDQRQPAEAIRTLTLLLQRSDLPQRQRALALRLMGSAHAASGDNPAAIGWYRKYLVLCDDAADRDRVTRQIAALAK